ncbi:MAG: tetratricopeptide repeat protein [Deltaproteobacteria bacterium]
MRSFFLFYLLSSLLGNPILALVVVGLFFYLGEARWRGRYFNPSKLWGRRQTIAELKRRVDINNHDVGAHNDLGRILATAGRSAEGLGHMQKAIARMDDSAETNYYLGLCLIESGNKEEGGKRVARALEINPRFLYGQPHLLLAQTYLDEERAEAALAEAQRATALNTSSVQGWVLQGRAHLALGDQAGARSDFTQARESFGHLPRYLKLPNRRWKREARRLLRGVGKS